VDLLVRLGQAATRAGAFLEAEVALDLAVARTEGDAAARRDAARALDARAAVARGRARWDEALDYGRRGLALVADEEDPVLAARLHAALGWVLGFTLGDNARGLAEGLRAIELLEGSAHLAELAGAYSSLAANHMRAGWWRNQLHCNRRSLEIGERLGSLELRARAHLDLGVNLINLGAPVEAADHLRRAVDLTTRMCATASLALSHDKLAFALLDSGDVDGADRELAEAVRLAQLCGGCGFGVEAAIGRARVAARRQDLTAARAAAETAVAQALTERATVYEGIARRVLGAVLSRAGERAGAERELERAEALLRGADPAESARVLAERARHLARHGDGPGAARLRALARPILEQLGAAMDLAKLEDGEWI